MSAGTPSDVSIFDPSSSSTPSRRRVIGDFDVVDDSDDDVLDVEEYPLRACMDCIGLFFRTGELE